ARAFLAQVTSDPTTVKTQSQVTEFIQSQIANPGDPILSVPSGQTFTLTSNTAVLTDVTSSGVSPAGKLTSANDTIEALNNLGNSVVIKDASTADNDTLKVILTAAAAPLVQNIENIELTVTNSSADLQMTNITGTKNVVLKGDSTADGKVSALPTSGGPTIVLDAGYAKTLTLAQTTDAGTSDSLTVKLNGTGAKAGLTINDGDNSGTGTLETLNLISDGATNTLTVAVDGTNTSAVGNTVITGSKDLTLIAAADDMLSGTAAFQKIDATGHTGQLTLQIGDTSAATAIADTAISLTNYKGVDRVVLNDDTVVTVSDAASGIVVDANSDAAFGNFTISGNSTVAATASNADVATLNLTSKTGTIMSGTVTFTGFETLIINSTNVNHTITGALTTSGSPTALDTVKIGGNKDLTLSAAPSGVEKIDATGFTGKLIMAAAGASMLEIVGGDGSDTIYGGGNTSSPTVVNMGKGDDTYVIGAQSDVVTGGDGADTFNATTLANTKLVSGVADKIMDFTSGTDKIKVGTTIDGNTTDTTLAVQTLTWNTDLATTLGGGTYAADTAYFVKISGGSADGNYYLILNDSTPAFSALADGVIQIVGATSLTAADIIA
ncbi:beta strand repeat-containing protein, partial [Methylothermus subterraneus]